MNINDIYRTAKQAFAFPGRFRATRRRGASTVEFAIVAPLLVTLILGFIEFGRLFMVEQILSDAAREGCRTATLPGSSSSNVTSVVTGYMSSAGISGQTTTIRPSDPSTANAGDAVTVTVSVPFSNVGWLPAPVFIIGKTLTATVVMTKESNDP